ncbi:MAG: hypothetical protein ACPL7B_15530, partial [Candidatus Poribacteria bacterium]
MDNLEPEKTKIHKQMLPILMKPYVLIILIVISVFGEALWMYRAIQDGNELESFILFLVGLLLGGINGVWTYRVFDKHYIQSILKKVNVIRQPMS